MEKLLSALCDSNMQPTENHCFNAALGPICKPSLTLQSSG